MPDRISVQFDFPGHSGETLSGRLELPVGAKPRAYAVFAHCFTCSKDVHAAARVARGLAGQGFAVLRFDFTGLGNSAGDFANTTFTSNVEDLVAAVHALEREAERPCFLIGHSLGGAATLVAAARLPELLGVITIGAPAEASHVEHHFADHADTILKDGEAVVQLVGRPFTIKRDFVEDIRATKVEGLLRGLKMPALVCHSPQDDTVDYQNALDLMERLGGATTLLALDGADHLLTRRQDAAYVVEVISLWAGRVMGEALSDPDGPRQRDGGNPNALIVTETGTGGLAVRGRTRGHIMVGDEPTEVGGADSGPTPYDHLLMALGSCTLMTLRLYAQHKGWDLPRLSISLTHARIHAQDCADCETTDGRVDEITRTLMLPDSLSEQQRNKLLEIADKCPVHRTLISETKIRTSVEVAQAKAA